MMSAQKQRERYVATVEHIGKLNADTLDIRLSCPEFAHYKAGQYLKVFIDAQTTRSYSLASAPNIDIGLHLHVRKSGGAGDWFHQQLAVGDPLHISAPQGTCFYLPVDTEQPLLFISTGAGLAPHYAMLRSALRHGHRGPIRLYHGVRHAQEFYLGEQLRELSGRHDNLRYLPCVSRGDAGDHGKGRALDIALRDTPLSRDWRVYLSGHPDMVFAARDALADAGAAPSAIFSDFFSSPSALSCAA
ncbi:MAG TPA: FAD-binding oxidoreductase [Methylophilaceae bacterium]|nr:FAD-binding oxidoreductase [Methylophilaceae bacterium]